MQNNGLIQAVLLVCKKDGMEEGGKVELRASKLGRVGINGVLALSLVVWRRCRRTSFSVPAYLTGEGNLALLNSPETNLVNTHVQPITQSGFFDSNSFAQLVTSSLGVAHPSHRFIFSVLPPSNHQRNRFGRESAQ